MIAMDENPAESYTFMCDLDRNLPEVDRAALTLCDDGEHIAVNFVSTDQQYAGTVYLTYADTANLGKLAGMLADDDVYDQDATEDDEPPVRGEVEANAFAGCLLAVTFGAFLVALAALVVALFA
ncbi:hypothetical protein BKA00_007460 [Actinomadura coerulea]|uniref:Uncharacterized protein n=1 Tax=Actinomadura coerulea TaxID=46159 RepID=A0A7X0L385_9ACTN|nr:hypothetical protein [Actinomadura coerulea]MBB6400546.1 hypothetical protein [Actinomadura coerulea]GGQ08024.1 hypothetical protein GCM10010187_25150 [Actinomadura coerulea]